MIGRASIRLGTTFDEMLLDEHIPIYVNFSKSFRTLDIFGLNNKTDTEYNDNPWGQSKL